MVAMSALKVLVVEDNRLNRQLMATVLGSEGFAVTEAGNGAAAWQKASAEAFDVIILDIVLPDMDGLDLARRLKADAATSATPIVAVTANAMQSDADRSYEAGCDAWIPKPVHIRTLGPMLRDIISRQRAV
jgi:CheY-like chemotaxis protein